MQKTDIAQGKALYLNLMKQRQNMPRVWLKKLKLNMTLYSGQKFWTSTEEKSLSCKSAA